MLNEKKTGIHKVALFAQDIHKVVLFAQDDAKMFTIGYSTDPVIVLLFALANRFCSTFNHILSTCLSFSFSAIEQEKSAS